MSIEERLTPEEREDAYLCLCVCDDNTVRSCPVKLCERDDPQHLRIMHGMLPLEASRKSACVERWPECESGGYDPRCCRFPKSCSCTVTENASSATTVINTNPYTCHVCHKRFDLRERDGGLHLPLHAHMTEGGMCSGSGAQVFLDSKSFLDSLGVEIDGQRSEQALYTGAEVAGEPKPVPPDVVRAAERLDQNLADARSGGYYRHGWYGYMDRLDIERIISHVLAQPRS